MANSILVSSSLKVSAEGNSPQLSRSQTISQSGTRYFCDTELVGTAAATIAMNGCATLKYLSLHNPSDSGKTITVTCAPIVLVPGAQALFPPSTITVTAQATAASAILNKMGAEA